MCANINYLQLVVGGNIGYEDTYISLIWKHANSLIEYYSCRRIIRRLMFVNDKS